MISFQGLSTLADLIKAVLVFVLFSKIGSVAALRLEEVAEPCLGNFITHDYDGLWDHSNMTINSTFYVPMASKYFALKVSHHLYETPEFKSINESHLESSCFSINRLNSWLATNITGYDGNSTVLLLTPTTTPKLFRFHFGIPSVATTGAGYASVAFSDNESYNVLDFCFDNGLRAFAVVSTRRFLDENTVNIIRAHMRSLGFQEKNFLMLNYEDCSERDGILRTNGNDLPKPVETVLLYGNPLLAKKYLVPVVPSFIFKKH